MDRKRIKLALALAVLRSRPRNLSFETHVTRIRSKLRGKRGKYKDIYSLLKVERSAFLQAVRFDESVSYKKYLIKPDSHEYAESVSSEETHFSAARSPSDLSCYPQGTPVSPGSPSLLNDAERDQNAEVCLRLPADEDICQPGFSATIPKEELNEFNRDSEVLCASTCEGNGNLDTLFDESSPPYFEANQCIEPFYIPELPSCSSLDYLAATNLLLRVLETASPCVPADVPAEDVSESDIVACLNAVLEYTLQSLSSGDAVWYPLYHGVDLATRLIRLHPKLVAVVRPVSLQLVEVLTSRPADPGHPRLLACLASVPVLVGSVLRTLNTRLQQASGRLQTEYRNELLESASYPPDLLSQYTADHPAAGVGGTSLAPPRDPAASQPSYGPSASPVDGRCHQQSALYVLNLVSGVLEGLHDHQRLLEEARPDLTALIPVLENATTFISDRFPHFVQRVFQTLAEVHDILFRFGNS